MNLSEEEWLSRQMAHQKRVDRWISPRLQRCSYHRREPVTDFLFEYYSFRPAQLQRWSPGLGITLLGKKAADFLRFKEFVSIENGFALNLAKLPFHRLESLEWTLQLLEITSQRPAQFQCFGLHEWAMVYQEPCPRHEIVPLRMNPTVIARFVESQKIVCSHFDAFRFFSNAARPLNHLHPRRETQVQLDQTGCVHVNMDLYKWAYKIFPWISSELIADAFELAWEARRLDMQASPYDLRSYGYEPIAIETKTGRERYQQEQMRLHHRSRPIRQRLIQVYRQLLQAMTKHKTVRQEQA